MKKIKKIWQENKVLLVLAIILLICLAVFMGVSLTYFYGSGTSVYGNRLDVTKETPITDELLSKIEAEAKAYEGVTDVSTALKGKIVYITMKFEDKVKMDQAKKTTEDILKFFSENELKVYDIEFSINNSSEEGYTLMGARNASGNGTIVWNNYNMENVKKESAE